MTKKPEDTRNIDAINIKQAVSSYAHGKAYFQIGELKRALAADGITFRDESIKKYLYRLKKSGLLFDAGRGWYSNIPELFVPETESLQKIIGRLSRGFPFLPFCCWSTAQLRTFFHHLPGKSLVFVYAEKDLLGTLYDDLRQYSTNCYLNPQKREVQQSFRITEETIILRPTVSEEPKKAHAATIEKIMVDLFIERMRLELFDEWEYQHLFHEIVMHHRIDMAVLIRYADRRKVKDKMEGMIH